MAIEIYNTASRKKEEFVPLEPGHVRMYVCGPTVYDFLHVGNFRGAVFFNLVRNWLEKSGYQVTFVYNYTDVEDKIIQKANKEGVESKVISEKYIAEFETDFNALKLKNTLIIHASVILFRPLSISFKSLSTTAKPTS